MSLKYLKKGDEVVNKTTNEVWAFIKEENNFLTFKIVYKVISHTLSKSQYEKEVSIQNRIGKVETLHLTEANRRLEFLVPQDWRFFSPKEKARIKQVMYRPIKQEDINNKNALTRHVYYGGY